MANVWRRCPSSRVTSSDLYQKVSGGVSQLVADDFFEGGAPQYVYEGMVAMALAPSVVWNSARAYNGVVGLAVVPTVAKTLARVYAGLVGVGVLPNCLAAINRAVSGQGALAIVSSCAAGLTRVHDGLVALALSTEGTGELDRTYGGTGTFQMVPSAEVSGATGGSPPKLKPRIRRGMQVRRKG